jgi:hypothetical protein
MHLGVGLQLILVMTKGEVVLVDLSSRTLTPLLSTDSDCQVLVASS